MGLDPRSLFRFFLAEPATATSANVTATSTNVVVIFDALICVALSVLIPVIIIARVSPSIDRMKTWYCLLLSCSVYCISFLLLVGQQSGPEPGLPICIIQAGLVYAAPPMVASAALLFVVELDMRLSCAIFSRRGRIRVIYWLCWGIPATHGIVFWITMILGLSDTRTVKRQISGAYCHIDQTAPTLITGILTIVYLVLMLIFEVYTVYHLVRQRRVVRKIRIRGSDFPLNLFVRTFAFSITGGIAIILIDILLNTSSPNTINLFAIIPLAVALLFGSQLDILRTLMFWRRTEPEDTPKPLPSPV